MIILSKLFIHTHILWNHFVQDMWTDLGGLVYGLNCMFFFTYYTYKANATMMLTLGRNLFFLLHWKWNKKDQAGV